MGIQYNTKIIGKLTLPEVNKTDDNSDSENPIYGEIELNPLLEVLSMETNWPKEKVGKKKKEYSQ